MARWLLRYPRLGTCPSSSSRQRFDQALSGLLETAEMVALETPQAELDSQE